MNWEEAVRSMRSKPENQQVILDNYFEADVAQAALRFSQSEEFEAVRLSIPLSKGTVLDIGAGRGMASFAFARQGFSVTALEPDPSNDVGAGAIKKLNEQFGLNIEVVESFGESLPFTDNRFDVVYVRQVLHHAHDLPKFCKEVFRVLKPGGIFIATREHVLSSESDLESFLKQHPLHHLYGGEHAFTLPYYKKSITDAGLRLRHVLHPYSSVVNYAPLSKADMKQNFAAVLAKLTGKRLAGFIISQTPIFGVLTRLKSMRDETPGRLYSFIATKP